MSNKLAISEEDRAKLDDAGLYELFVYDVTRYEKKFENWKKAGDKIVNIFRNETEGGSNFDSNPVFFNILWSNIQTLKPSLYSRLPKVVCQRRHKDSNPVGRLAAIISERATQYSLSLEASNFNCLIDAVVEDRLLPGRGVAWVRYEPTIETTGDADSPVDTVVDAKAVTDYIYWKDYGHTEARSEDEITAKWKRIYLTKDKVKERFGEEASQGLSYADLPEDIKSELKDISVVEAYKRAVIYERWDKSRNKVYWFSKGLKDKFLAVENDPLHLKDFFPCPRPLYSTLTNGSLEPIPDYHIYRGLADDLDYLTRRKSSLMEMVRAISVHDASTNDIMIKLKNLDDGDSMPIKNWVALAEKGGMKGAMQFFPLEVVADTINMLSNNQADLLQKIYEITGMSDIIRGNSSPSETATAQQIKGQYATLRLSKKQAEVQRFAADLIQRKAEVIFAVIEGQPLFSDEMIAAMVGMQSFSPDDQALFPEAMQLLRSDKWRTFQIEIETDSTLAVDEQLDKQEANEFIAAVGNLFQQAMPMMQGMPDLTPFMIEMIKFGARRYRTGKTMESSLEKALDALMAKKVAAENQPPQPPPPDPKMIEAQTNAQVAQGKLQLDTQVAQQKMQLDVMMAEHKKALDEFKAQQNMQIRQAKMAGDQQIQAAKVQGDMQIAAQSAAMKQQSDTQAQLAAPQTPVAANPPIMLNINVKESSKKVARFKTDPLTGQRVVEVEEVPDVSMV